MHEHNIMDIWRIMNENCRIFTWQILNPIRKLAKLDFLLVNKSISQYIFDTDIIDIIPGYWTDHKSILLNLKLQKK